MLSRVAEQIYWMARYIERAGNTARLVNVNSHLLLDLPKKVRLGWEPLVYMTGSNTLFSELYGKADARSVVRFLTVDTENPSSILSALSSARESARTIRDLIPREAWEEINQLYLTAKTDTKPVLIDRHRFACLSRITFGGQAINGILSETMSHDEAYDLLLLGRHIERADMTTRILDVRTASLGPDLSEDLEPFENILWMSVLKSLTAYQMYRRKVRLRVRRPDVLKFLLQDTSLPHAVAYSLAEAEFRLRRLPQNEKPLECVADLQRRVADAKPEALQQDALHKFLDTLQIGLIRLHKEIDVRYF